MRVKCVLVPISFSVLVQPKQSKHEVLNHQKVIQYPCYSAPGMHRRLAGIAINKLTIWNTCNDLYSFCHLMTIILIEKNLFRIVLFHFSKGILYHGFDDDDDLRTTLQHFVFDANDLHHTFGNYNPLK